MFVIAYFLVDNSFLVTIKNKRQTLYGNKIDDLAKHHCQWLYSLAVQRVMTVDKLLELLEFF